MDNNLFSDMFEDETEEVGLTQEFSNTDLFLEEDDNGIDISDLDLEMGDDEDDDEPTTTTEPEPADNNNDIYDSLYVYYKVFSVDIKNKKKAANRKVNYYKLVSNNKKNVESIIGNIFMNCIRPIVTKKYEQGKIDLRGMKIESLDILHHLINTFRESNSTVSKPKPNKLAGRWVDVLSEDMMLFGTFWGGAQYTIPLLEVMKDTSIVDIDGMLSQEVDMMIDSIQSKDNPAEESQAYLNELKKYIKVPQLKESNVSGLNALRRDALENYVRQTTSPIVSEVSLIKRIHSSFDGNICGTCSCGEQLEISNVFKVTLKRESASGRTSAFYSLQIPQCPKCGKNIIIYHEILYNMGAHMYMRLKDSMHSEGSITSGMTFIAMRASSYSKSDMFDTTIHRAQTSRLRLEEIGNEQAEYVSRLFEYRSNLQVYTDKVITWFLRENKCHVSLPVIAKYILAKLDNDVRTLLDTKSNTNKVRLTQYIDYTVTEELKKVISEDTSGSRALEFSQRKTDFFDFSKVRETKSPYKDLSPKEKVQVKNSITDILSQKIDIPLLLKCSEINENVDGYLNLSRLGLYTEEYLFGKDSDVTFSNLLKDIFTEYVLYVFGVPKMGFKLLRSNINKTVKGELIKEKNEIGYISIESLFEKSGTSLEQLKQVPYQSYKEYLDTTHYSNFKPRASLKLNGEFGLYCEYLCRPRTHYEILSKFLKADVSTSYTTDDEILDKDEGTYSLDCNHMIVLAILRAFPEEKWRNPGIRTELVKYFKRFGELA